MRAPLSRWKSGGTSALLIGLWMGPTAVVSAQEADDELPECPSFSTRTAEGLCACDEGYGWSEDDLLCLLLDCPDNSGRPPGQEKNPFGCKCLRGFTQPEEVEDCVAVEPCEGENEVRNEEGECYCPSYSTAREDASGCDCDEGHTFSEAFWYCVPDELQCPDNSHGDEAGECVCDDGYKWEQGILGCDVIVSECGPHTLPSAEGGCICEEGFHPGPPGTLGCVGEIRVRCQPNAHEDSETGECVCNPGYPVGDDGRCERETPPPDFSEPDPDDGEEGEEEPDEDVRNEPRTLCTTSGPGGFKGQSSLVWAFGVALALFFFRRKRVSSF